GDIVEEGRKSSHTGLKVNHRRWGEQNDYAASMLVNGKHEQVAVLPFAGKRGIAPVIYFNGPLTLTCYGGEPSFRPGGSTNLSVAVGTQGIGTFTVISYEPIPEKVFPVARFEFPSGNPERPSLQVKVILDHRC